MIVVKTDLKEIPFCCAECKYGKKYGLVGDTFCKILEEYFTGNVKPPHKERPDECPLVLLDTEVKHGFWFISEYEYLNCSVCGEAYFTGADSTAEAKERLAEGEYYPYCPHCGAKMDAEPPKKGKRK